MNRKKITANMGIVIVFCMMIFLPNLLLLSSNHATEIAESENRPLMEVPKLLLNELESMPAQYESYYNSVLPFKLLLTEMNSKILYHLFDESSNEAVIVGKEDWLFYNSVQVEGADAIGDYRGINQYTENEIKQIGDLFEKINAEVSSLGAELYIVIAPSKETIYDQYLPSYVTKVAEETKASSVYECLKLNTNLKVSYPEEILKEYKDDYQLYYKADSHWNELGAYLCYTQLKEMKGEETPMLDELTIGLNENHPTDLLGMMNLEADTIEDYEFTISDELKEYDVKTIDSTLANQVYEIENPNGKKLLMFRDSFTTALIPFLNQDFGHARYVWSATYDNNVVKEEEPDVVIFEVQERYLDMFLTQNATLIE